MWESGLVARRLIWAANLVSNIAVMIVLLAVCVMAAQTFLPLEKEAIPDAPSAPTCAS